MSFREIAADFDGRFVNRPYGFRIAVHVFYFPRAHNARPYDTYK